jgi:hypothetical protein
MSSVRGSIANVLIFLAPAEPDPRVGAIGGALWSAS